MLGQRRRRWANIISTLGKGVVIAGKGVDIWGPNPEWKDPTGTIQIRLRQSLAHGRVPGYVNYLNERRLVVVSRHLSLTKAIILLSTPSVPLRGYNLVT